MFGNKPQSIKTLGRTVESFQTMIGEATEIHGRLVASESLRIDGKVIGNVETSQDGVVSIAVGKNGIVQGDIYAYRVILPDGWKAMSTVPSASSCTMAQLCMVM